MIYTISDGDNLGAVKVVGVNACGDESVELVAEPQYTIDATAPRPEASLLLHGQRVIATTCSHEHPRLRRLTISLLHPHARRCQPFDPVTQAKLAEIAVSSRK